MKRLSTLILLSVALPVHAQEPSEPIVDPQLPTHLQYKPYRKLSPVLVRDAAVSVEYGTNNHLNNIHQFGFDFGVKVNEDYPLFAGIGFRYATMDSDNNSGLIYLWAKYYWGNRWFNPYAGIDLGISMNTRMDSYTIWDSIYEDRVVDAGGYVKAETGVSFAFGRVASLYAGVGYHFYNSHRSSYRPQMPAGSLILSAGVTVWLWL